MRMETESKKVDGPGALARVLQDIIRAESVPGGKRVHFWTIGLDSGNVIKFIDLVTLSPRVSKAAPREAYRIAVMKGVDKLVTAHNRPSGLLKPSRAEIASVAKLFRAGEILGIRLVDHLIVSQRGYTSFCADKHLSPHLSEANY